MNFLNTFLGGDKMDFTLGECILIAIFGICMFIAGSLDRGKNGKI